MIVNVGHRNYGYQKVEHDFKNQLQHYLDNVAPKHKGSFVDDNIELCKSFLGGKKINARKFGALAGAITLMAYALIDLIVPTEFAFAQGSVNTAPLDRFFKEVYWTMLKVLFYITTPIIAWVGYIITLSGASTEKRSLAKKVGISIVIGMGVVAGAPWMSDQLYSLWMKMFA